MPHLSRRDFLKCAGITLAGSAVATLPSFLYPTTVLSEPALHGRALKSVPVYTAPAASSKPSGFLWPDSVHPIGEHSSGWYRLADGYVRREGMQPMILSATSEPVSTFPAWIEVGGSVAIVRAWCAADAPLVARIGHGGIAQVVDVLHDHQTAWYALAGENGILGWTQAAPWHLLTESSPGTPVEPLVSKVMVDTQSRQLTAYADHQPLLRAPVTFGTPISPSTYTVQHRQRSVKSALDHASEGYGTPWQVELDSFTLAGAYWHNRFGTPHTEKGPSIQVTPSVAKWLFHHLHEGMTVRIR